MGLIKVRTIQCDPLRSLKRCFSEIEGFFNLLFSHFVSLLPLDAPETQDHLVALLSTIATADHQAFVKYRMYALSFTLLNENDPNTLQTFQLVQCTTPSIEPSINSIQDSSPTCQRPRRTRAPQP